MNIQPFNAQAIGQTITTTATASASAALPAKGSVLRVVNTGTKHAYISVGSAAQVATVPSGTPLATCTPVLAGTDISLSIPSDSVQNISAICGGSDSTTLVVQVGEGL